MTLHDCGHSNTAELTHDEAAALASDLQGVAELVPENLIRRQRRQQKRQDRRQRWLRFFRRS